MKPSAKSGVALTITALSLVVSVGAGASGSIIPVDENWLGRGPYVWLPPGIGRRRVRGDMAQPIQEPFRRACTLYLSLGALRVVTRKVPVHRGFWGVRWPGRSGLREGFATQHCGNVRRKGGGSL